MSRPGWTASAPAGQSDQEAEDCQHGKDKEQDLADANGAGGDAAKTEQGCDQGDDKKYNGVVQHGRLQE